MALTAMDREAYDVALTSGQVFLVFLWTDWHEGCAELAPVIEELACRYEGQAIMGSMNIDFEAFWAMDQAVYTAPTVIIYNEGIEVDRIIGPKPLEIYDQTLDALLHPEELNPYEIINSMGYLQ